MSSLRAEVRFLPQRKQLRRSRSCSQFRRTLLALASSPHWRDQAATLQACRYRRQTLPASELDYCVTCSPISADWRSSPMSALPEPSWKWLRFERRLASSILIPKYSKCAAPRILRPLSGRLREVRRRFMFVRMHWSIQTTFASTLSRWARGCPLFTRSETLSEQEVLCLMGQTSRTCSGGPAISLTRFSRGRSLLTFRSNSQPSLN